jgi:imidazolonepropionase
MSLVADFSIVHADALVPCSGPAPRRGPEQGRLEVIADGAVASLDGRIVFVGTSDEYSAQVQPTPNARTVDARGCTVVPGFVDPHTHAVYAGDRRQELRRRLAGAGYAEIAAENGGIVATVAATRAASEDRLIEESLPRLRDMLRNGTTTCEVKSGYGLATDAELKMLRAIRRLDALQPVDLVATFLGAHEVPLEYRNSPAAYVEKVIEEMIPRVAESRLAQWCDVFCESAVFTPNESEAILQAGMRAGLRPRIHADELGPSGGALVAASVRARSADHLVFVSDDDIGALADAGVVATLLPAASFYLKLGRYAPARRLIEAGVTVALATDVNPGGGLSPSMPFAMALGCFAMEMTLEEALTAATINAAYALDRDGDVGSLEPGKLMDAVLVRGTMVDLLRIGASAIAGVFKRGRAAFESGSSSC